MNRTINEAQLEVQKLFEVCVGEEILSEAREKGWIEPSSGVYLNSRENLLAEQVDWNEFDEFKTFDFSKAPFWITTDDGTRPGPIYDGKDAAELLRDLDVDPGDEIVDRAYLARFARPETAKPDRQGKPDPTTTGERQ